MGLNCRNVLSIKFHNISWGAFDFDYQIMFRWSSKLYLAAKQDLLWILILTIFLEMIPCCLPLSSRESLRADDYLNIIRQPKVA